MLFPEGNIRVWLCTTPTDMRKSFTGLSALVKHALNENPLNGQCYVFVNRKRTLLKMLFFDRTGFVIWSKRLEQGQFVFHHNGEPKKPLSFAQLQCLLEGIELKHARRYKRFSVHAA